MLFDVFHRELHVCKRYLPVLITIAAIVFRKLRLLRESTFLSVRVHLSIIAAAVVACPLSHSAARPYVLRTHLAFLQSGTCLN